MPNRDLDSICQALIAKLDEFRAMWFNVVLELADDALKSGGATVVNRDFDSNHVVLEMAENTPADFPFNKVNGQTMESALIGLQSLIVLQFCLSNGYLTSDDFPEYTSALMGASADNDRWLFSVGAFFGSSGLSGETVSYVLARYLLNQDSPSTEVSIAQSILEERLPFLAYFTQVGTAIAFEDELTAARMMHQIGVSA